MPKYRHLFSVKMKQHQIQHMEEGYAVFLQEMDDKHEEYIQQTRKEHKEHKKRLIEQHEKQKADLMAETIFEIQQNTTGKPLEIAPGIVVLPDDYYVEDPIQPFGIARAELETNYEEVK